MAPAAARDPAPALAVRIRRELEERYGPEYEEFVALLAPRRPLDDPRPVNENRTAS